MKITKLICSAGYTGFYFDDQRAIKEGAQSDGAFYVGEPATPGFTSVRQAGESISVMLMLENGTYGHGDCAAVQYSGAGGRDPLFLASDFIPVIEKHITPLLVGKEISSFREMADIVDKAINPETGKVFHTAIRYGVTQALLDAVAKSKGEMMAQVIADEYNTEVSKTIIPLFSQSGDDRYLNADKMIMKQAPVLPHALFNNVATKCGMKGEKIKEYLDWLKNRILTHRPEESYHPNIHIDVYGTLGIIFDNDLEAIASYIGELAEITKPFSLRVEGPVDMGAKDLQIEAMKTICEKIDEKGIDAQIVADEWCNTLEDIIDFSKAKAGHIIQIKTPDLGGINNSIEAVLYCKEHGVGAYLGGTCNETNRSSEVCAHVAMATSPMQYLSKPGMGVDEGYMIGYNEMSRILAMSY